jgi:chemotaxis protein histidine kinase CheA
MSQPVTSQLTVCLDVREAVDESSPLAHRGNAANLPIARNGAGNRSRFAPKAGPSYRRASSETLEPVQRANFPVNRKRTSQANISDVFGIESKSLHISQTSEEERPKRYKNDGSPSRKLSYGSSSDSDDVATPGTPDTKGKGVASPGSPESSAKKLQESPKIVSGTPTCPRRSSAKTPSSALPTKSPRQFPLPDSPEGSPVSSPESSPIISLQPSPMRPVDLSPFNQKKSHASITAAAASARFGIFEIKSHHYTEAVTRPTIDRKLAQGLESIYTNVNRFDPQEAAELEEEYQRKIRIIYDRQVAKEQRQIEKERLEKEKIRLAEEKRKLEEDQKQREEEERVRKEQEEIERKKREEEEKKAKAEQDKKDAEARRIAEEKAKAEKEAREKAEQQQAAAAAANAAQAQAQAQAQAAQAQAQAQQAQSAQQATPEVYGRMSMATKAAAVRRIIENLKGLKKLDQPFLKNSGLNAIRRELMPKFGQLTGQKDQTIQVVRFSSPSHHSKN